jgi:hypothetical protein
LSTLWAHDLVHSDVKVLRLLQSRMISWLNLGLKSALVHNVAHNIVGLLSLEERIIVGI